MVSFRAAMAQMLVEGGRAEANLRRAELMVRNAATEGAELVVLPECLDLGWTHPSARELAEPIPGRHAEVLCRAAAEAGIHVVAGLTERAGERIYNAAILASPAGDILLKHRKINELEIGQNLYSTGDRLAVCETPLGTLGVNICADNFPDSLALAHALARMGCRLLLSPSAWAVGADHDNAREPYGSLWLGAYSQIARLYGMTVIGTSNVGWLNAGPWAGRKCIGCSLAVGPDGNAIAQGPYGECAEALITVDLAVRALGVTGTAIASMLAAKGYTGP